MYFMAQIIIRSWIPSVYPPARYPPARYPLTPFKGNPHPQILLLLQYCRPRPGAGTNTSRVFITKLLFHAKRPCILKNLMTNKRCRPALHTLSSRTSPSANQNLPKSAILCLHHVENFLITFFPMISYLFLT